MARIVQFVEGMFGVSLPSASIWTVSRVVATASDLFDRSRKSVKRSRCCVAPKAAATASARRRVIRSTTGAAKLRKGKAYAKGPHLEYAQKQPGNPGRQYSELELAEAGRLMRLEVTLGREWFRRVGEWSQITPERLAQEWESYYGRMLGGIEVMEFESARGVHAAAVGDDGKIRSLARHWRQSRVGTLFSNSGGNGRRPCIANRRGIAIWRCWMPLASVTRIYRKERCCASSRTAPRGAGSIVGRSSIK